MVGNRHVVGLKLIVLSKRTVTQCFPSPRGFSLITSGHLRGEQ